MTASKSPILFVIIVLLTNSGCTTIKPIDVDDQTTFAQQIKVGDKVRLAFLDERVREISVTEINDQEIIGKLESGGVVIADWRDIYDVEQVRISPLKTTGAALGIIVAIPVIALLALASGCVSTYC